MWQHWNTSVSHGYDPWGGLSALGILISKLGVAGADSDSDDEGAQHIEEQDAPKPYQYTIV